jgi:hypothetical protein
MALWPYVEIALAIGGLALAGLQTIRLEELRKRTKNDLWLSLRMCRAGLRRLEESQLTPTDPLLASAHGSSKELFCQLLKQAINEERKFSEDSIQKWRQAGKLENEWQIAQARQFLETERIA